MNLSRRHILKNGDQWLSMGWRFEDEDGWIDVEEQYFGKTVAAVDPNNLHLFRRKGVPQKSVERRQRAINAERK